MLSMICRNLDFEIYYEEEMERRFAAYDLPVAIFLASAVVGIFPAYDRWLSAAALAALLAGGILYAALARLANTRKRWDAAALALSAVTAVVSVYYVTQSGHMGYAGKIVPLSRAAGWIARVTPDLAFWRPLGNTIGTFVEGGVFILAGLALAERRKFLIVLLRIGLAFTCLALVFSASRGAWTAVIGAGMVWAAIYWQPARWLALAVGTALLGLALYVLAVGDVQAISSIPVVGGPLGLLFIRPDRLEVYSNSLALARSVPFTGIGLGSQFGMVYSRYGLLLHVPYLYYAHNLFLEIWLEQGVIGLSAWVWLIVSIFTNAWRWGAVEAPQMRIRYEATWIGLAAVIIHGFSDARQAQAVLLWLPFFALLGLNAALLPHNSPSRPYRVRLRFLPAAAGASCLLLVLLNAWPLPAALYANQAALIQHRADLSGSLSQMERDAMLDRAAGLFAKALDKDPANWTANQRMGLIALSRQDFSGAVPYLKSAHEADMRHPGTRRALGLAYAFSGSLDEAALLLRGQLNIVDELNYWGWHYHSSGKVDAGLNAMRVSLMLQPDQPEVRRTIDQAREE